VSALIVGSFVPFTRLGVRLAFTCHPERSEESQLIHAYAHTLAGFLRVRWWIKPSVCQPSPL